MKHRPEYLDLARIRLPLPGFVSILHRMSGFILFLALPLTLYLLEASLNSGSGFDAVTGLLSSFPLKMLEVLLLWALLHHLCAGLRILLLDMGIGTSLPAARAASKWVLSISLALTILIGIKLW